VLEQAIDTLDLHLGIMTFDSTNTFRLTPTMAEQQLAYQVPGDEQKAQEKVDPYERNVHWLPSANQMAAQEALRPSRSSTRAAQSHLREAPGLWVH